MSRNYAQKPTSALPWNWTDQRVQEIMKKYEQPTPPRNSGDRTPLRTKNSNQAEEERYNERSPWKGNYLCKPTRQECTTPQNKTFDIYSKENPYERSDARSSYSRPEPTRSSKRTKPSEEPHSFFDYPLGSQESDLIDAKNYLREQERKYLKIDLPKDDWRQRDSGSRRDREENWRESWKEKEVSAWKEREGSGWKDKDLGGWKEKEGSGWKEREVGSWRQRDSMRNQKLKTEVSEVGRREVFKDVEYEPRINNIERINNKIKRILESANNEEKEKAPEPTTPTTLELKSHLNRKPQQTKESSANQERKLEERSKSCLAMKKNIAPCELTQKVNDQLARFSNKITEFEEQKRKLNISFKKSDTQLQESVTSPVETASDLKRGLKQDLPDYSPLSPLSPLCNIVPQPQESSQQDAEASPNFHSPYIGLKELDNDESLCVESQQEQLQQISRNMELRRRQREEEAEEKEGVQTNRLLAMLSEQVQLDEQLQLAKKWFARTAQQPDWALLQELLSQRWREMSTEQLEAEFSITLDEEDPFYSYRPDEFELEDLVANYIICCRHWGEKVEGQWSGQRLRAEGCFGRLDREGRGELAVEDLVREINLSQAVFYRNRNLYLLFQRLTHHGAARLTEDRLYAALTKK